MDSLYSLIQKRLNQHKLGGAAHSAEILHTSNLLLKEIFKFSKDELKAFKFKDGILYISVNHSTWGQELFYKRDFLKKKLCDKFGLKAVSRIIIKSLTSS